MKIILAIVDELPKSAMSCKAMRDAHAIISNRPEVVVYCRFDLDYSGTVMGRVEYATQRCPNCPLVEEAEEVQE